MASADSNSTATENMASLDRFLEELHEKQCRYKLPDQVVTDLQHAVEELIRKLVDTVSHRSKSPLFRGTEIIARGSFYEGTKIKRPDEFDFLLELDDLSQTGAVEFREECSGNPGATHVLLLDPKFHDAMDERMQKQTKYLLPETISQWYRKCMSEAYYKERCEISGAMRIDKVCGYLTLSQNISNQGPNTMISAQWTTVSLTKDHPDYVFPLTVDVTPAILYPRLLPAGIHGSQLEKRHVIPALIENCDQGKTFKAHCWRISNSSEEFQKMETLTDIHKKMYKVLKCVCVDGKRSLRSLNSYMLKTALLHHVDTCENRGSLGTCTLKLLEELSCYAQKNHLPGYFFPEKNVWKLNVNKQVVTPLSIVKRLRETFENIARHSLDSYDSYMFFREFRLLKEEFEEIEIDLFRYRGHTELSLIYDKELDRFVPK